LKPEYKLSDAIADFILLTTKSSDIKMRSPSGESDRGFENGFYQHDPTKTDYF
jgi:hypothetical protein